MSRLLFFVLWMAASALAATTPPNVILITLDTTRADRMGFLGSTRGLTPNLDVLAQDSVVFTRAYSQAPLTPPSHASILTGTYPQFHQVNNFGVHLAERLPYLPVILKRRGYQTGAFVAALALDAKGGSAPGFERGFDIYDGDYSHPAAGADRYHSIERRGGEVVDHALAWLDKHSKGPFFLWVHLYDAHDPYEPPEPYKSKYATAPYDGEIAYADASVGKLLRQLRTRGLYRGSVIAVMADHGEALGDHGEETHGIFLYDETIHVPLLVKLPGPASTSAHQKQIDTRVELVDVLPTILQAAGIAVPKEVQGESLLAMLKPVESAGAKPAAASDRAAYAETDYGRNAYGWSSLHALRAGKYLYVDAPHSELYDQAADEKAEHNLSSASAAVSSTLAGQIGAFRQKTSSTTEAPKANVDPEVQEKLAALGYASSTSNKSKSAEQGADPKDKIAVANLIHQANLLGDDGRCDKAIPLLQELVSKEPEMETLYAKLAHCLTMERHYKEAVPIARKLLAMEPDSISAHFQLGKVWLGTGDFEQALPELEGVVAKVPKWPRARLVLANAYVQRHRYPDAIKQYDALLAYYPEHFEGNLFLGRALMLSGDLAGALPPLEKAEKLQPAFAETHVALSSIYLKLGRDEDAAREQIELQRLKADRTQ